VHSSDSTLFAHDPLTAALLPVVIHQLNNATQLLANLHALLSLGGADELLRARSDDLTETARSVHELGYVLAVLASASGADLLLERREARGLEWMLESVRHGLRRDGHDLADCPAALPLLSAAVGDGWELPWAVGSLLHAAGQTTVAKERLGWSLEEDTDGWELLLPGVSTADLAELPALVDARLPGASCADTAGGMRLALPAEWLHAQPSSDPTREPVG